MSRAHPSCFFKYYTAATAKIVLSTGRIRWNSPLNFNDPFDCHFSFAPKFDQGEAALKLRDRFLGILCQAEQPSFYLQNRYVAVNAKLRELSSGKSRAELEALHSSAFDELAVRLKLVSTYLQANWRERMASYRLFCVCEQNDNLLLWAHYTHNHSGAAFQFECLRELDVPLLAALPVQYSDDAPGLATEEEWLEDALGLRPLNEDGEVMWKRLVTTKARAWEHEREWRVIMNRRPYENVGFEDCSLRHSREISKVFLGCRISETDKADLLNLLSGPFAHVEAYQAKQSRSRFALDFERIW